MAARVPRFAPAGVDLERRADGTTLLRSPQAARLSSEHDLATKMVATQTVP
jgi:hypothetical protein